jgi:hypothetical protein
MTRNEILEVAGKFYKPETITEREVAFARHMMDHEREACARACEERGMVKGGEVFAARIRARGQA